MDAYLLGGNLTFDLTLKYTFKCLNEEPNQGFRWKTEKDYKQNWFFFKYLTPSRD